MDITGTSFDTIEWCNEGSFIYKVDIYWKHGSWPYPEGVKKFEFFCKNPITGATHGKTLGSGGSLKKTIESANKYLCGMQASSNNCRYEVCTPELCLPFVPCVPAFCVGHDEPCNLPKMKFRFC